jgi:hypothetical protein
MMRVEVHFAYWQGIIEGGYLGAILSGIKDQS